MVIASRPFRYAPGPRHYSGGAVLEFYADETVGDLVREDMSMVGDLSNKPLDTHESENCSATLRCRVLTLNVHKGFGFLNRRFILPELRDAVRTTAADLVFLQEVIGAHEQHARRQVRWPTQPQYEFLADTMWPQFAYGRNAVYQEGNHGNALLSKLPISRFENIDISVGRKEKRGLLHAQITVPNRPYDLHAICVHLALRESHRRAQLTRMVRHIHDSIPADAPLIVAGDFNDWRGRCTPILREVDLLEAFAVLGRTGARSFPGRWPLLRLDRIYVRNAAIGSAQVLSSLPWPHLSDHVPLLSEILL
jgi:endonuclease/exonuclease/phosphatase family metal-dependent hydrolase